MPKIINSMIKPVLQYYSMDWLKNENYAKKMGTKIRAHIAKTSRTNIGQKLGISSNTGIRKIPFTHYGFYEPFFENPQQGDFIYQLEDYVRAFTSGTMGRPKTFLLPKKGLWNSISKTGMTFMFLCTHNGDRITYEVGDTVYENMPGGQFISSFYHDIINKRIQGGWVNQVPDVNLTFQQKIDYYVENYKDIDVAYMTVTSLLDQVYPKIKEPLNLKGFITQDRSAFTLKDKIKKITGSYPKTVYGSTETMFGALPSIEYPGCFFFDWRILYPEFIPEDYTLEHKDVTSEPIESVMDMSEVEVGRVYQFIATPYGNDLIRYVMPDLLECIALGDEKLGTNIPVFRYYSRSDNLLVLHNFTRINEDELLVIIGSTGIEYVDFVVNRELVDSREYLKLYIELKSPYDEDELYKILNERLTDFDKDWNDLREMLEYDPLIIQLLPKGTFQRYLQRKTGVPKYTRVNMSDENLKLLLS